MTGRDDVPSRGVQKSNSSGLYTPDMLFPGVLPVVPEGSSAPVIPDKDRRSKAATAASAAGVRAISAQALQFYFRAPVKAFFRTRVDYLAYARGPDGNLSGEALSSSSNNRHHARLLKWLRGTTPGVLTIAIKRYGWSVVPNQILPPLAANIGVATVLYTSYLHILGRLHPESAQARRRVYPPPAPTETFAAGFLAGSIQSLVAAPLDAIQARYDHGVDRANGSNGGRPQSMWLFSWAKLREIGLRGIFAGWGLSFLKDSLGSAVFFSVFEYVKAQGYYRFVMHYYGAMDSSMILAQQRKQVDSERRKQQVQSWVHQEQEKVHHHHLHHHHDGNDSFSSSFPSSSSSSSSPSPDPPVGPVVIRPHYALEPIFLLLAGVSASFSQQLLLHPLTHLQVVHWDLLEDLDDAAREEKAKKERMAKSAARVQARGNTPASSTHRAEFQLPRFHVMRTYYHAYMETWRRCKAQAAAEGRSMTAWLYRGFWYNSIRQVPSTSAGLIIFELVRRKYDFAGEEVRISQDGYDILLE